MAARSTFKISDPVRDVLSRATITATTVTINDGQLDRKLYLEVNKALEGAGGKWNKRSKAHVFERDPREALGLAVETGKAVNLRTKLQSFYTPPALAERVAGQVGPLSVDAKVLEPSIGEGALIVALALKCPQIRVTAYDIDPVAAEKAAAALDTCIARRDGTRYMVRVQDFLTVDTEPVFDAVVMNSPFTKGADMAHVTHAWGFVKRGGVLVAIVSPAYEHTGSKAAQAFRELLLGTFAEVEKVPAGTFEHTDVETRMITMRKPK